MVAQAAETTAASKVFSLPSVAAKGGYEGATVLWGGRIFQRENMDGQRCVGVVGFPLSRKDARPDLRQDPGQVFCACSSTALDERAYSVGRQVAVAGKVADVLKRVLSQNCALLPRGANVTYRATAVEQVEAGCSASMPVVMISDGKTWIDPSVVHPILAHPPEFL